MRRLLFIATLTVAAVPSVSDAALIGYSTNQATASVETNQNGLKAETRCLLGCGIDLHLGIPGVATGSATARIGGSADGTFGAFAEALGGPDAYARASATGLLEFYVSGSDATWTATAQGRLGGSAALVDLTSGASWRVDYATWPAPVVSLTDGHAYRMTLGAGGISIGNFYPGGSARVVIANGTFVDVPEPATLSLGIASLAGFALTLGLRRR